MASTPDSLDELKKWVAECLILQTPEQNMIDHMMANGYPRPFAQSLIDEAKPYLAAFPEIGRELAKRDWLLDLLFQVQQESATAKAIERRSVNDLSSAEFLEHYYSASRPVVITDALAHWPALGRWTPEYLLEKYGDQMVEVQTNRESDPIYEHNAYKHKEKMRFSRFIQRVVEVHTSNDFYMTGNNMDENKAVFADLFKDTGSLPPYLADDPDNPWKGYFWFGPAGTITKLHHDICNGFLVQIYGRKLIKLISPLQLKYLYHYLNFYSQVDMDMPDLERFPLFKEAKAVEVTLYPGEILFIPVAWWHYVRALDISISLSFNNFCYNNQYAAFYEVAGPDPT